MKGSPRPERLECRLLACKQFCIDWPETRTPNILSLISRVVVVGSHDLGLSEMTEMKPYITLALCFELSQTLWRRHYLQYLAAVYSIGDKDVLLRLRLNDFLDILNSDMYELNNIKISANVYHCSNDSNTVDSKPF